MNFNIFDFIILGVILLMFGFSVYRLVKNKGSACDGCSACSKK